MLTFLILLTFFAFPVVLFFYTIDFLLGPVSWLLKSGWIRAFSRPQLPGLLPDRTGPVRQLLAQTPFYPRAWDARELAGQRDGFPVYLRAQAHAVNAVGASALLPWNHKERRQSEPVLAAWLVVDARGRLPESLQLQVYFGVDETILGDEALAVGLLDSGLRQVLRSGDQLSIAQGLVGLDSAFAFRDGVAEPLLAALVRMTRRLVDAVLLNPNRVVPYLLLSLVREDAEPAVRARAVELLLERHLGSEEAAEASRLALDDESPLVRFAAARHAGDAGFAEAEKIVRGEHASGLRQRALRFLLRRFEKDKVLPVLRQVLAEGPDHLRQIAARYLGAERIKDAVPWLTSLEVQDSDTAVELALALRDIGDPSAEDALIALLQHKLAPVRAAAADALGVVGGIRAVPKLRALRATLSEELQIAADTAVELIQARAGEGRAGGLSLIADGPGELSLAEDNQGNLSMAKGPRVDR